MKYELFKKSMNQMKFSKAEKKAYAAFTNQKSKCENPNNPDYKYYGAKGIKVKYSRRELMGWWLTQYKQKKWIDPTVGRIDHNKDYCFDNIIMQERRDNSMERIIRLGEHRVDKKVISFKFGKKSKIFKSATQASIFYKISNSTVVRLCNNNYVSAGKIKSSMQNGLSFKYKELEL